MKPIKRKTTNTTFKRPDCYDLPGTRYKYEDEFIFNEETQTNDLITHTYNMLGIR